MRAVQIAPPGPAGLALSGLLSHRHSRRCALRRRVHRVSTFLRPLAPRALPRFDATMGALTPARLSSPDRSPRFMYTALATIPSPTTSCTPAAALTRCPSARRVSRFCGSRLHHSSAGSPDTQGRIEFVILRTGRSPPVASHPASRRRGYSRLQAGERIPEADFHRSDHVHSRAHRRASRSSGTRGFHARMKSKWNDPSNARKSRRCGVIAVLSVPVCGGG